MALPLIPLAFAGLAGTVGGGLLFGRNKDAPAPTKKEMFEYSPTNIHAPQTTDARQDSRTLVYQPSVVIDSPNASVAPVSTVETRQGLQATPAMQVSPSFDRQLSQSDTGAGINNNTIILLGVIAGGAIIASSFLRGGRR